MFLRVECVVCVSCMRLWYVAFLVCCLLCGAHCVVFGVLCLAAGSRELLIDRFGFGSV